MKILITGGAGFIGRWLIKRLPPEISVTIVDNLDPEVHLLEPNFSRELLDRATCIQADICDTHTYQTHIDQASVIVHLAANTGTGQSMSQKISNSSKKVHSSIKSCSLWRRLLFVSRNHHLSRTANKGSLGRKGMGFSS
jgi:dTDP-L-rhamnose 4-epimerase